MVNTFRWNVCEHKLELLIAEIPAVVSKLLCPNVQESSKVWERVSKNHQVINPAEGMQKNCVLLLILPKLRKQTRVVGILCKVLEYS